MCKTFKVILLFIVVAMSSAILYSSISVEEKPTLPADMCSYHIVKSGKHGWWEDQISMFPFYVFGNIRWHSIINCGTCVCDEPVDLWANDPEKRSHIIVYRLSAEQVRTFWNDQCTRFNAEFKKSTEIEGLYAAAFVHHAGFMHDLVLARITFTIHVLESGDKIAIIRTISAPEFADSVWKPGTASCDPSCRIDVVYNAYASSCKCLVHWIEIFAKKKECSAIFMKEIEYWHAREDWFHIGDLCDALGFQPLYELKYSQEYYNYGLRVKKL